MEKTQSTQAESKNKVAWKTVIIELLFRLLESLLKKFYKLVFEGIHTITGNSKLPKTWKRFRRRKTT